MSQRLQSALQDLLDGATSVAEASAPGRAGPVDGAPGALALIAHRGEVLAQAHAGWAVAFDAGGTLLPEDEREPITPDHVWDVASVTKLLTAVTALAQVDDGVLDLDRPVAEDLPELVSLSVTDPLGLTTTGYVPAAGRPAVATEYQQDPPRGLVRGHVHDETAWTLGGAGNAGIFSTAGDLLTFAEEVRTGAAGLLTEDSRALLRTGTLTPTEVARIGFDQAIGFRLGQDSLMATTDQAVLGHGGFTGAAVVIDPARELVSILLTNRVHPRRHRFEVVELRRNLARLARTAA